MKVKANKQRITNFFQPKPSNNNKEQDVITINDKDEKTSLQTKDISLNSKLNSSSSSLSSPTPNREENRITISIDDEEESIEEEEEKETNHFQLSIENFTVSLSKTHKDVSKLLSCAQHLDRYFINGEQPSSHPNIQNISDFELIYYSDIVDWKKRPLFLSPQAQRYLNPPPPSFSSSSNNLQMNNDKNFSPTLQKKILLLDQPTGGGAGGGGGGGGFGNSYSYSAYSSRGLSLPISFSDYLISQYYLKQNSDEDWIDPLINDDDDDDNNNNNNNNNNEDHFDDSDVKIEKREKKEVVNINYEENKMKKEDETKMNTEKKDEFDFNFDDEDNNSKIINSDHTNNKKEIKRILKTRNENNQTKKEKKTRFTMMGIDRKFVNKVYKSPRITSQKFDQFGSLLASSYSDGIISLLNFDQFIDQHFVNSFEHENDDEIDHDDDNDEDNNVNSNSNDPFDNYNININNINLNFNNNHSNINILNNIGNNNNDVNNKIKNEKKEKGFLVRNEEEDGKKKGKCSNPTKVSSFLPPPTLLFSSEEKCIEEIEFYGENQNEMIVSYRSYYQINLFDLERVPEIDFETINQNIKTKHEMATPLRSFLPSRNTLQKFGSSLSYSSNFLKFSNYPNLFSASARDSFLQNGKWDVKGNSPRPQIEKQIPKGINEKLPLIFSLQKSEDEQIVWAGGDCNRLFAFDMRKLSSSSSLSSSFLQPIKQISPLQILIDQIENESKLNQNQNLNFHSSYLTNQFQPLLNRPINMKQMQTIRSFRLIDDHEIAVYFGDGSFAVIDYFNHEILAFYQPPFIPSFSSPDSSLMPFEQMKTPLLGSNNLFCLSAANIPSLTLLNVWGERVERNQIDTSGLISSIACHPKLEFISLGLFDQSFPYSSYSAVFAPL